MAEAVFYVFFLHGLLIIFVMTLALVISLFGSRVLDFER